LIQSIPLKEASNSPFPDVDLEVACHEKSADKYRIRAMELWQSCRMDVERRVEGFHLIFEAFVSAFESFNEFLSLLSWWD
jgi:hypothetical protein